MSSFNNFFATNFFLKSLILVYRFLKALHQIFENESEGTTLYANRKLELVLLHLFINFSQAKFVEFCIHTSI